MDAKRITLFAGHYGSGKTNIAVNYALRLKENFENVSIADLDIVNPYFRTKDSTDMLADKGIHLISSEFANTNVDVPALPGEAYSILDNKDIHAVIDVGGDDRGALALGRYTPAILNENNYEMLFVINRFRPLTRTVESILEVMNEIEAAAGMKFTGIANNSNLGDETTAQNVIDSLAFAKAVAKAANLEIRMNVIKEDLFDDLRDKINNLFPIKLYVKQSWERK